MDDILRNIIYLQNEDLLQRIAKDKYIYMEDREAFLNKYHKKNFTYLNIVKKDSTSKYLKTIIRRVK